MQADKARETALKILYDIDQSGAYSNISMSKHFNNNDLKDLDKAFITELVNGITKWRLTLDWIIGQNSSIKLKKISKFIINILRLGIYQIIYLDKVPDSAACDESVKLAKRYGNKGSVGFVNAVLRSVAKSAQSIQFPTREDGIAKYLSVKYSHPEWLIYEWIEEFGAEFTENLLESNNLNPKLCIRVNTLRTNGPELAGKLAEIGIETFDSEYGEGFIVKEASNLFKSEFFKEGYFQVQDESSMLVSRVLDPREGELVIDVCAAPGGKATHIAQIMNNSGTVIARDIHEHKIKLINELSEKLGTTIVKAELFDSTVTDEKLLNKADRVLVDAPCTGFGILRRKPDIKWTRKPEDRVNLVSLQKKILEAASGYVKPDGILVYSTCTIGKKENNDVVEDFLKKNRNFKLIDISLNLPERLKSKAKNGYMQLFPNVDNTDGFFIAGMRRSS